MRGSIDRCRVSKMQRKDIAKVLFGKKKYLKGAK